MVEDRKSVVIQGRKLIYIFVVSPFLAHVAQSSFVMVQSLHI